MFTLLSLLLTLGMDDPKPKELDTEQAINAFRSKGVTPKTNAAVLLWQAFGPADEKEPMPKGYFKEIGIEPPAKDGRYFLNEGLYAKRVLHANPVETNHFINNLDVARRQPWNKQEFPDIAAWLKLNEPQLKLIVEASRCPGFYHSLVAERDKNGRGNLTGMPMPSIQRYRTAAQALTVRAMFKLHRGQIDDAWADLMACHRLGRLIALKGTWIEFLVGTALESMARTTDLVYFDYAKLTPKQLRACRDDLEKLPPMNTFAEVCNGSERLLMLDTATLLIQRGMIQAMQATPITVNPQQVAAYQQLKRETLIEELSTWFDRAAAVSQLPTYAKQLAEIDRINADLKKIQGNFAPPKNGADDEACEQASLTIAQTLATMSLPSGLHCLSSLTQAKQQHDNLLLTIALKLYHAEHGNYPDKLDALVPKFIKQLPLDRFTAKPLHYARMDNGCKFHSVGINLKDEQGRIRDDNPKGDDITVVLTPPIK